MDENGTFLDFEVPLVVLLKQLLRREGIEHVQDRCPDIPIDRCSKNPRVNKQNEWKRQKHKFK